MNSTQEITIEKDANGNVFVSGNSNIVIVQASHISEPSPPKVLLGINAQSECLSRLKPAIMAF